MCHVTRTLSTLPIESLRLSPDRPTRPFPRPGLLDVLAARDDGPIPTIVVEPPGPEDDRYSIVSGEYWWRVAQAAQLATVNVAIALGLDAITLERLRLDDPHRPTTPRDPIAAAERIADYVDETGLSLTDIASEFSTSRTALSHLLRLRSLHPDVQAALSRGALSVGHGRALAALPPTQQTRLAARAQAEGLSVRAIERLAQRSAPDEHPAKTGSVAEAEKDPDIVVLERQLAEHLGVPVDIHHRGAEGSLVLHFSNLDVFETILERLQYSNH
ncbi:MAG: ParB/RepB/Spo0J family partition protein [Gammaproteobacteria bacterium]|nr:ParB/RepB/Spo0J family partition protein [Gammaproteobacteria bacterium]